VVYLENKNECLRFVIKSFHRFYGSLPFKNRQKNLFKNRPIVLDRGKIYGIMVARWTRRKRPIPYRPPAKPHASGKQRIRLKKFTKKGEYDL
jgi:hypothetical protein